MKTVLLVDDDPIVRKIIGAILERSGFTLLIATDAEMALQAVAAYDGEIEVLISDIIMPGLSGEQLAETLTESRPSLKVLLISALPESPIILRDRWMFLSKPFPPKLLLEKLAELVPA